MGECYPTASVDTRHNGTARVEDWPPQVGFEAKEDAMYARLVRFEGAEPGVLERELEQMRTQIRSGMSGESTEMDEQQGGPSGDEMEMMRSLIKRVLVLADRGKGSSAMVVFADSEDDIRRLDTIFSQMSPPEGGGQRQSVDVYEVAIDEASS
jgi:hypothetical protein